MVLFLYPEGILIKKWEEFDRKITRVTCGAGAFGFPTTSQVVRSLMPQDPYACVAMLSLYNIIG